MIKQEWKARVSKYEIHDSHTGTSSVMLIGGGGAVRVDVMLTTLLDEEAHGGTWEDIQAALGARLMKKKFKITIEEVDE